MERCIGTKETVIFLQSFEIFSDRNVRGFVCGGGGGGVVVVVVVVVFVVVVVVVGNITDPRHLL